jgi:hypothetical protein
MILAQSYLYKDVQVTITIDPLREWSQILYHNKLEAVKTMDIMFLNRIARHLIDKEVDGDLYFNGDQFRRNVRA